MTQVFERIIQQSPTMTADLKRSVSPVVREMRPSTAASPRPKSDKFLKFMDDKRDTTRINTDPDGVCSSLSLRTKVHLDRAKKLLDHSRFDKVSEEELDDPTVSLSSGSTEKEEEEEKPMSLIARKNSLVKRFAQRENFRILSPKKKTLPLASKSDNSELIQAKTTMNTENSDDSSPTSSQVQVRCTSGERFSKLDEEPTICDFDMMSVHWDTQTVVQEQTRIRTVLESRLGVGYNQSINKQNFEIDQKAKSAFFIEEINQEEYQANDTNEEETVALTDCQTTNSVEEKNTASSESKAGSKKKSKKDKEKKTKRKSSEDGSESGKISNEQKQELKIISNLRPIFKEWKKTSTRAPSSGRCNNDDVVFNDTPQEILSSGSKFIDTANCIPSSAMDPPLNSYDSNEKIPDSLWIQKSLSTTHDDFGFGSHGNYDKYAAALELDDESQQKEDDEVSNGDSRGTNQRNNSFSTSNVKSIQEIKPSRSSRKHDKHASPQNVAPQNVVQFNEVEPSRSSRKHDKHISPQTVAHFNESEPSCSSRKHDKHVRTQNASHFNEIESSYSSKKYDNNYSPGSVGLFKESETPRKTDPFVQHLGSSHATSFHETDGVSPPSDQAINESNSDTVSAMEKKGITYQNKLRATSRSPPPAFLQAVSKDSRSKVSASKSFITTSSRTLSYSEDRHSRSHSLPRSVSGSASFHSEESPQSSRARSVSPPRPHAVYERSSGRRHLFHRHGSYEVLSDEHDTTQDIVDPPTQDDKSLGRPPSPPVNHRKTSNIPIRPKTAVASHNLKQRLWIPEINPGVANDFKKISNSFESTGLNTLDEHELDPDNKSIYEECRDPPEGKDPPGKLRVERNKDTPVLIPATPRASSRASSRSRPSVQLSPSSRPSPIPSSRPLSQVSCQPSTRPPSRQSCQSLHQQFHEPAGQVTPFRTNADYEYNNRSRRSVNPVRNGHTKDSRRSLDPDYDNVISDTSPLSSSMETLEAENHDLKRQLSSMIQLLEESDASVANLQETIKRGESSSSRSILRRRYAKSGSRGSHRTLFRAAE